MRKKDREDLINKFGLEEAKRIIAERRKRYLDNVKSDPIRLEEQRRKWADQAEKRRTRGYKDKPEWRENFIKKDPLKYHYKNLLSGYKRMDKEKGRENDLDMDWMMQNINGASCHYCGVKENIGVDRKDSSIGHLRYQCVPCCKSCNSLKSDRFSYEEMLIIGEQLKKLSPGLRERGYENARNYAKYMSWLQSRGRITQFELDINKEY